jgi:tetratricopeptide (TPR) repeat protein
VWRWSASTHFRAARAARRARLYPEAERHLAQCEKLQGGAPDKSFPLALERLLLQAQSGNVGEVEEVLWDYVKRDEPETPLILEALARGYLRMLRLSAALGCLRRLLEREPDNVEALLMRGWIRGGGGEPREGSLLGAIQDYRRALELSPERDDARLALARVLVRTSPKEARDHFEYLLARQPDNRDVQLGLAEAYWALGQPERARPVFEALLEKDPKNSRALAGLGAVCLGAGDTAEAEGLLRKAIAADPGNVQAHYQLYRCLVRQPGRKAEAIAQRDRHERVAADYARLGEIASKEMTRNPRDPNLHYEMGAIYLKYGKPEVGLRWLYSALKLDPTHQRTHRALTDYYKRTGQPDREEQHRRQLRPRTENHSPPASTSRGPAPRGASRSN